MSIFEPPVSGDPFPLPPAPPVDPGVDAAWVLAQINALFQILMRIIANIVNSLKLLFGALGKFLLHLWQNYVKKAIQWLVAEAQKILAWMRRIVKPIIARLEKIKKWYDEHILKQQLRMLQMIQSIRRFLGILRLFHVAWAARLDNSLADIQQRIEVSISIVRGLFNQIINTLTIAFDPRMLITSNVLGASLLGNLAAIKRIFGYGGNRIFSANEVAQLQHDSTLYDKPTVSTHVNALLSTGPTDEDKTLRVAAQQSLAEGGYTLTRF
jgi:hypothetical protein